MKLLVSMGVRPGGRPDEPLRPRLCEVDPDRGVVSRVLDVTVDPESTPGPAAHQELTCADHDGEGLVLQPAHTELLWIDPASLRIVRRVTHPLFHGLHSATAAGDRLIVTCAGIESVLELDRTGRLANHHFLRSGRFGEAYPGIRDFRLADHDAFKPHSHHPNHACRVGEDLWVTCFETAECRSLTRPRVIPLGEGIPHDGRLRAGWLWFTQVVGRVIAVDPVTLERRLELDLRELSGSRRQLGWIRGVEVVGSRLFVGATMLRATRHREVLRQLLLGEAGAKLPTRLIEIDLDRRCVVRETVLGNAAGGTIYGVLATG